MRGCRWRRTDFKVTVEGVVRLHMDSAKVVVQRAMLEGREVEGVVNWYVGVLNSAVLFNSYIPIQINRPTCLLIMWGPAKI